jgi:hypothetical protein
MGRGGEALVKRILKGATYDTETSRLVARYSYDDGKDDKVIQISVDVYMTNGGAFFIVSTWPSDEDGVGDIMFETLTRSGLDDLVARTDNFEIIDSSVISEPPEAVAEEEPTLYPRIPPSLKARHEGAADVASMSANAWG